MVSSPPPCSGALPERSRNAKAQARHRAKRKAYITHLEHSVTRLSALAGVDAPTSDLTQHDVDRIQQLEDENTQLRAENERLRAQLGQSHPSPTTAKRASFPGLASDSPYTLPGAPKSAGVSPQMRPIFTESRTSSYSSVSATSPSNPHSGSYYGLATANPTASPTSSSSTGSPFSPSTTSPLALPGLKLPPTHSEQRSYTNGSSGFPSANDQRSSLPSLPRMLPSLGSYSSYGETSPTYGAKPEHESHSNYQISQQHSSQSFAHTNYSFDPYTTSVESWASSRARV